MPYLLLKNDDGAFYSNLLFGVRLSENSSRDDQFVLYSKLKRTIDVNLSQTVNKSNRRKSY